MRSAKDERGDSRYPCRSTKSGSKVFFSRLAKKRRNGVISTDIQEEIEIDEYESESDDADEKEKRADLINLICNEFNVAHPIYYDAYDLSELHKEGQLSGFKVPMLKELFSHFELEFKLKDRKQDLICSISNMLDKFPCFNKLLCK